MIKRKKINLDEERRILSQMIVSTRFLSELRDIALPTLFKSTFSQTVANWVWEYFNHTESAPQKAIEDVYLKNRHLVSDEDENELIGEFLGQLSRDWESTQVNNIKYSTHNAIDFFKLRSLEKLSGELKQAVENKDSKRGENIITQYKRVERISTDCVDVLNDAETVRLAFQMDLETLFSMPSELGRGMGSFKRGDLYAVLAPPKRGKSWWLMFIAIRAALMGLKVVFISLEMNQDPVLRRLWKGFIGQPDNKGKIEIPCFSSGGKDGKFQIGTEFLNKMGVDLKGIEKHQSKYQRASRGGCIKLKTFPSNTATVKDLEDCLDNLEYYDEFVADVIVVDYADILIPENPRLDYRHQLNSIWLGLRSMAQKREALVATGSQTGRTGMSKDASEKDVAEDMRKIAHVTKIGILNQNDKEKEAGVLRYKVGVAREEKAYMKELVVLQGFEIGRPYLECKPIGDVDMDRFKIEKKGKKK